MSSLSGADCDAQHNISDDGYAEQSPNSVTGPSIPTLLNPTPNPVANQSPHSYPWHGRAARRPRLRLKVDDHTLWHRRNLDISLGPSFGCNHMDYHRSVPQYPSDHGMPDRYVNSIYHDAVALTVPFTQSDPPNEGSATTFEENGISFNSNYLISQPSPPGYILNQLHHSGSAACTDFPHSDPPNEGTESTPAEDKISFNSNYGISRPSFSGYIPNGLDNTESGPDIAFPHSDPPNDGTASFDYCAPVRHDSFHTGRITHRQGQHVSLRPAPYPDDRVGAETSTVPRIQSSQNGKMTRQSPQTWGTIASPYVPSIARDRGSGLPHDPSQAELELFGRVHSRYPTIMDMSRLPQFMPQRTPKRPTGACAFCRLRKVGCVRPDPEAPDQRCSVPTAKENASPPNVVDHSPVAPEGRNTMLLRHDDYLVMFMSCSDMTSRIFPGIEMLVSSGRII
ncbi:hypothetical protein DFH07DRAFT_983697 [Mycena maculata]|uniref:Uncharacterized protein n=1 Tax=Mycena maculata TaxID=230809 RepID=A0AAD7MZX4_9AGAR|nr:hypothetical protein DFH07DRAFT_983697 [Mycena maculata]